MTLLVAGLLLFLGVHSVRIVAEGWRARAIARWGEPAWKAAYSVVSIAGFVLVVWGYGGARSQPLALWAPPPLWTRHLAGALTLVAFVLLAAAYVPGNAIKSRLRHPMVLGVMTWALAHLLANHTLADALLFGGFLLWSALDWRAARARDRVSKVVYAPGRAGATGVTVAIGVTAWVAFAFWGHPALIGVRPFV